MSHNNNNNDTKKSIFHIARNDLTLAASSQNSLPEKGELGTELVLVKGSLTKKASLALVYEDVMNGVLAPYLDVKDLLALASCSHYYYSIFRKDENGALRKELKKLLLHVVRGEQAEAEARIKANPSLLLMTSQVETYAQDLAGHPVIVKGTAFQLAMAAEDEEMALMIAPYLDKYYPGQKQLQYQAQFPPEEEENEKARQAQDSKALTAIFTAIAATNEAACELVLNRENEILADDKVSDAGKLLNALNQFREAIIPTGSEPKGIISTSKHFNSQLLIEAFNLYAERYDTFGPRMRQLCWLKVIGYIERFLPTCYGQVFAQGIISVISGVQKLRRSFDFRFGGGQFFPLDSDLNFRLGINYMADGNVLAKAERWGGSSSAAISAASHTTRLCQAKTAALERIMKPPYRQSKTQCLVM